MVQPITPNLWFDTEAEEAAAWYASIFPDGRLGRKTRFNDVIASAAGQSAGSVMTAEFSIAEFAFIALNGGSHVTPTPAISFIVHCESADEVDEIWSHLVEDGTVLMPLDSYPFSERYGWVQDRFDISWQLTASAGAGQRIVPSMLFVGDNVGKAEDAISFYTSVFRDAATGEIARYGPDQAPDEEGTVMYGEFVLEGQHVVAMDSNQPHAFQFNEGISLQVACTDQEDIDHYWDSLSADPSVEQCGWLRDRFGVSWQIVPTVLPALLRDSDDAKVRRTTEAMLNMGKLDIAQLQAASAGST